MKVAMEAGYRDNQFSAHYEETISEFEERLKDVEKTANAAKSDAGFSNVARTAVRGVILLLLASMLTGYACNRADNTAKIEAARFAAIKECPK